MSSRGGCRIATAVAREEFRRVWSSVARLWTECLINAR